MAGNQVGDYSGDPKTPRPKKPHEVLGELMRSNPDDPTSGPTDTERG